jgi:hypothetical protein
MTYEEKVHYFGLRWLMDNSASVARLREYDTTRLISIHEYGEEVGCSCDYDYEVNRTLVVPTHNGQTFSVSLPLTFAEVMKGILEAEPVELSGVADYVMEGQATQIENLKTELRDLRKELASEKSQHNVLKNGLKSQTALWTFLRNLYKDLQDYGMKKSDALNEDELLELCDHLYRELDLWFNENIDGAKTVWAVNTTRSA